MFGIPAKNTQATFLEAKIARGQQEKISPAVTLKSAKPSSLIEAVKKNNQEAFFKLLNLKIDLFGNRIIDEVDEEYGENALYWAANLGYVDFIDPLIKAGVDANKRNKGGITPVHVAALKGHAAVIAALKAAGANVDTPSRDGFTPVFIAAENGHAAAIVALHAAGANVDTKNRATPIYMACQCGHVKTMQVLVGLGANVDTASDKGETPTYVAAEMGHAEVINVLKSAGANVNIPDNNGKTPVYIAAQKGRAKTIVALHAAGANVNTPNNKGETPIHVAIQNGHASAIAALHAAGARVAAKNKARPIYTASRYVYTKTIEALGDSCTNVGTASNKGKMLAYAAVGLGKTETRINLLNAHATAITALEEACLDASIKIKGSTALEEKKGQQAEDREVVKIAEKHFDQYHYKGIKPVVDGRKDAFLQKDPPLLIQFTPSLLPAVNAGTHLRGALRKG